MGEVEGEEKKSKHIKGNKDKFTHMELVFYLAFCKEHCHACSLLLDGL